MEETTKLREEVASEALNKSFNVDSKIIYKDLFERGKKDGKLSIQEVAIVINELNFN